MARDNQILLQGLMAAILSDSNLFLGGSVQFAQENRQPICQVIRNSIDTCLIGIWSFFINSPLYNYFIEGEFNNLTYPSGTFFILFTTLLRCFNVKFTLQSKQVIQNRVQQGCKYRSYFLHFGLSLCFGLLSFSFVCF